MHKQLKYFRNTILIGGLLFCIACNTGNKDSAYQSPADSLSLNLPLMADSLKDSTGLATPDIPDTILLWNVDADAKAYAVDSFGQRKNLSIMRILNGMKRDYPGVPVRFRKIDKDTVVLYFDDNGTYLSQRMGSSGPVMYARTLALNIFEFSHINFIRLEMEEGDHAGPDLITREILSEIKRP